SGLVGLLILVAVVCWCIYQCFFSPLACIPGPFTCKLIPTIMRPSLMQGRLYLRTTEWHQKYGPIVRVGCNTVSVIDKASLREVYQGYDYAKVESWYQGFEVFTEGMFTTRNADLHRQRKRILQPAFTLRSLRIMEPTIIKVGAGKVSAKAQGTDSNDQGVVINLYQTLTLMTLDIITELTLGKAVGVLEKCHHPIVEWFYSYTTLVAVFTTFPFLKKIKLGFSKQRQDVQDMGAYSLQSIQDRRAELETLPQEAVLAASSSRKPADILDSMLLSVDPLTNERLDDYQLKCETLTIMFGGSETTSVTMCMVFFYLFRNPDQLTRLQADIIQAFPLPEGVTAMPINLETIEALNLRPDIVKERVPFLEAVIHETMRLLPAAPGIFVRSVPKGGRTIGPYFLPEDTEVGLSMSAYHRGPEWEDPHTFNPDRFLGVEGEKNVTKLMTFSSGPHQCIGKNLAYMELFSVLATMLRLFYIE
ncbi:cytochrome P450, partial [Dimargaris cristalligena]